MEDCTYHNITQRSTTTPSGFFRVPGLFVRLSSRGLNAVDNDSVWSPTSPLDFKNLSSNIGTTSLKSPGLLGIEPDDLKLRASSPRIGLGLLDALTAGESSFHFGGKSSFLDSIRPFLELALPKVACRNTGSVDVAVNGIAAFAQSEEYTCVIERSGPNPRTTHILGGETPTLEVLHGVPKRPPVFTVEPVGGEHPWPSTAPAGVDSGLCSYCGNSLRQDMDIYMYLGEKAFCSNECRKGCIQDEIEICLGED